jgi:NAD(P)H-nitrite reductase large subunit
VNEYLQTTVDNIYAAGDVAEYYDIATGEFTINALWPNAVIQGKIAGINMVEGNKREYEGSLASNSIEFFGLPLISCGVTKATPKMKNIEIITKKDDRKNWYKKIVLRDDVIVGFVLIGKIESAGIYRELVRKKINISSIKHYIGAENFSFSHVLPLVKQQKEKFIEEEYKEIILSC